MTKQALIQRLRAANPVPSESSDDEALFSSIVATPGDPRLGRSQDKSTRHLRKRWLIVPAVLLLVGGVGVAGVQHYLNEQGPPPARTVGDPLTLFKANHWMGPGEHGYSKTMDQSPIPSSMREAAVVTVSKLGEIQFWYADANRGGWCGGLQLPNGKWEVNAAPICRPTREQIGGNDPVYALTGFDYDVDTICTVLHGPADQNGHLSCALSWDVSYGIVPGAVPGGEPAVRVIDLTTGRSTSVGDGGTFALALPTSVPPKSGPWADPPHLVAYDADGNVVADTGVPGTPGRFSGDAAH
jgi:hypothetical protein